ncbi:hypothetical protein H0H87_011667 [Tephrocybe sp. NHM501043]|nr:hypothetical protein H0H87_011667 [Tephrocybe sp. NHM501043]
MSAMLFQVAISFVPTNLMNIGGIVISAFLLVTTVVGTVRPRAVTTSLDSSLRTVSEKLYHLEGIIEEKKISRPRDKLMRLQIEAIDLRLITFRVSGSLLKEFVAFITGHSFAIAKCIQDIHALDDEIEVSTVCIPFMEKLMVIFTKVLKAEEYRTRVAAGERLEY